jgi:DNA-directed RNA polymerase subunit F
MDKYNIEEIYAINIININPQTVPELRTILEKSYEGKSLDEEQLQEILYTIEELKT